MAKCVATFFIGYILGLVFMGFGLVDTFQDRVVEHGCGFRDNLTQEFSWRHCDE